MEWVVRVWLVGGSNFKRRIEPRKEKSLHALLGLRSLYDETSRRWRRVQTNSRMQELHELAPKRPSMACGYHHNGLSAAWQPSGAFLVHRTYGRLKRRAVEWLTGPRRSCSSAVFCESSHVAHVLQREPLRAVYLNS